MYVGLNGRYTKSLVSCQMRSRRTRPFRERWIIAISKYGEAHLRNAESLVRVALDFSSVSARANVPWNVRKRSLSEPRRAESLFSWHTWTSILFARETLHFQPIHSTSHSHGAKHCFVKNFPPACLSAVSPFVFFFSSSFFCQVPVILPTRTQSREYRASMEKKKWLVGKEEKRDKSRGKTRDAPCSAGSFDDVERELFLLCERRVLRTLDQASLPRYRNLPRLFSSRSLLRWDRRLLSTNAGSLLSPRSRRGQCSCKITPPSAVVARSSLEYRSHGRKGYTRRS